MKPFRNPFALETAEGFPVDDLLPASRVHPQRETGRTPSSNNERTDEKARKHPKEGDPDR